MGWVVPRRGGTKLRVRKAGFPGGKVESYPGDLEESYPVGKGASYPVGKGVSYPVAREGKVLVVKEVVTRLRLL